MNRQTPAADETSSAVFQLDGELPVKVIEGEDGTHFVHGEDGTTIELESEEDNP
jgi:hypothetical protein